MSCDVLIFVEEAADAVAPLDLADLGRRAVGKWPCGRRLPQAAVRPVIVVMACKLAQHRCSVPLVDDQKTVEEFASDGADEAFGDRVRSWCAHRAGAENPVTSCDLQVFVDEAAEPVSS
jgi:hypothetical protein